MSARSRSGPQSFFSGCSNVHISGGTFNDIAGDLNQYFSYSHQVAVQYNRHNSSMSSVVSPSTMYSSSPPNRSNTDPGAGATRRGAGRGNYSGVRMSPYMRGSAQSTPPGPPFAPPRVPGRGDVPSTYNTNTSVPTPPPSRSSRYPPAPNYQSGSRDNFLSSPGNCWAYTPSRRPPASSASYRNHEPIIEDVLSDEDSENEQGKSDDEISNTTLRSNNSGRRPEE